MRRVRVQSGMRRGRRIAPRCPCVCASPVSILCLCPCLCPEAVLDSQACWMARRGLFLLTPVVMSPWGELRVKGTN